YGLDIGQLDVSQQISGRTNTIIVVLLNIESKGVLPYQWNTVQHNQGLRLVNVPHGEQRHRRASQKHLLYGTWLPRCFLYIKARDLVLQRLVRRCSRETGGLLDGRSRTVDSNVGKRLTFPKPTVDSDLADR